MVGAGVASASFFQDGIFVVAFPPDLRLNIGRMAGSREPTLRVTMLPRDTNARGTIFGGVILSHIDLAGGIVAARQAARNFVTRAMREVAFIAPVYVGDVVSFYARVVGVGTTSVTVQVTVEAERMGKPDSAVPVTQAEVIYVAVDEAGKAMPLK